jgi:pyruvate formate-lyase activating enzyme-like uncharacterized protein
MKTKYSSYNLNGLPEGCKYCVKGEKLVLFISGVCSRNCWYCSLSDKRKNKNIIWANEREIKNTKEFLKEIKESNATSMGITGGDPLLFLKRTIKYAKTAKKTFGKKFHIHIYLPTKFVNKNNLKKLSKYIDEIRFNPECSSLRSSLSKKEDSIFAAIADNDLKKIKLASIYWKKQNIGIELPMIPEKEKDFLELITKAKDFIGFVNLNEFELSETNINMVTKKYTLNQGGYTIKDSIKSGIWLLKQIKKRKINLKVHLCTAKLKNNHQFKNRLKLHNILPFGYKTKEGMVKYLVIDSINKKLINKLKEEINKQFYIDNKKKRVILSQSAAAKLLNNPNNKYKISLVEEFPTYDQIETEKQEIK